jgi:hypothetical protein
VCRLLSADPDLITELESAKAETQFSKAIAVIKHAIPSVLLIKGQNPLALLHDAISEGLHAHSDEECLEIATDIRIVMADLAERLGQALKDEAELSGSVSRLINRKAARTQSRDKNADGLDATTAS